MRVIGMVCIIFVTLQPLPSIYTMKHTFTKGMLYVALTGALCGCNGEGKKAEELLGAIRTEYETGKYDDALAHIDSLRKKFPEAIEARKEALKIYQDAELKKAQTHLASLDTTLQRLRGEYDKLKTEVEQHKQQGVATAEELTRLTLRRLKLDSLQTRFDVEVAKIKYIHKRQAED